MNVVLMLLLCLLPVFLFRKSIRETLVVGLLIILFLFFQRGFLMGERGSYHDTFWGLETLFYLVRYWIRYSFYPGWNPFMNAGEPVFLFSNFFSPFFSIFFCLLASWVKLSDHIFFNQCWTFMFLNFCLGAYLLFRVLFDDFKVAIFCFVSLLLSGSFPISLGQPCGLYLMGYFPYLLFGLVAFFKDKKPYALALALIYAGIILNYYNPLYFFFITSFFIVVLLFLYGHTYLKIWFMLIRRHSKVLLVAVVLSALAAGPVVFWNYELKRFVSPTRGALAPRGMIGLDEVGTQPRVTAVLSDYRILWERALKDESRGGIHHAFYFGIMPLLFIPVALLRSKSRLAWAFFLTAVFAALMGQGDRFILFFLYRFFPGFGVLRHTFQFAQFVSFFLICTSGFGLKALLTKSHRDGLGAFLLVTITALGLFLATKDTMSMIFTLLSCLAIVCSVTLLDYLKNRRKAMQFVYILIFSVLISDLCFFNIGILEEIPAYSAYIHPPQEIVYAMPKYPLQRTLYASRTPPVPTNFFPVFLQEASLTSSREDLVLFRSAYLNDMLKFFSPQAGYAQALGVDGPPFYFTGDVEIAKAGTPKESFIKAIYADSSQYSLTKERKVFFLGDDIDASVIPEDRDGQEGWEITFAQERRNPNMLEVVVEAPRDGFLVRLENFHSGWQAFVNGKKSPIYRANYAFQAVKVPKGRHRVFFKFVTIYPLLLSVHIVCVFVVWGLLNLYLFNSKFSKEEFA